MSAGNELDRADGQRDVREVNEALIAMSVRQHELILEGEQARRRAEELAAELRASEEQLAADFADMTLLRDLAARLVTEDSIQTIYEEILSCAIGITKSDGGTIQTFEPQTDSLVLLATRGFDRDMTDYYRRVGANCNTACGIALRTGKRTFIDFDDETDADCIRHVDAGYRSAQAVPLVSRSGTRLGMLNTHWHQAGHRPDERQLHFLDLLVRQAADLIEERRMERTLRESEERFRTLANTAPAIIWITESDGSCSFLSHGWYEFSGQTEAEALGFGWLDAVHPHDRESTRRIFREANEEQKAFSLDYRLRRADGEYRWVIDTGRPRFDEKRKFLGSIGSVIDSHERKQAEENLREADRRKSEFLAMLAHELRNPLAPIRNAVSVLRVTCGGGEAVQSATEMMERQVDQLVRLVDDLLDVSRISRGKIELRRSRVDLASIVRQSVEASRPMVESAGHQLRVTVSPDRIYLDADPARLAQVLDNLLTNACKFTDKGGHISLTVDVARRAASAHAIEAVIRVRDSGIGIAPEQIPHIFDLFMQVDTSLERSVSGLGIGLTMVKELVEMHGGTVEAHSDGLTHGSEFVVRLPVPVEMPKQQLNPRVSEPPSKKFRRILVVDDNRDSAESLAMLLELTGNTTHTACDGLEAVEAAAAFKPDVVLLDIGLPKLNGYEACRRIRNAPWAKNMVLVALTGWGQEEDRQRSRDAGFNGHMVKPVDLTALTKLLDESGTG